MDKPVTLILAATVPALGIGRAGGLPWSLKREMKYFRQVTEGGVVVMGRRTWDSIPPKFRPLKNRLNIVITSSNQTFPDTVLKASSLDNALQQAANHPGPIFVIGGAQLYASALDHPQTKHLLLTEITADLECDAFFQYDKQQWTKQSAETLKEFIGEKVELESTSVSEDGYDYEFTLYNKK